MLIDDVTITVRAGHGGAGKVSFDGHGPDGGNGGRGGDVYISSTSDLRALNQFSVSPKVIAQDGAPGTSRRSGGKDGQDTHVVMPIGTTLTDTDTGETWDFVTTGEEIKIAKGGLGGKGNLEFKSGKNRSPMYAQPGLPGVSRKLHVVLKYLADFGLVGLPNAGKSSLLNVLTRANAEVGAYPFTTLEANLGAMGTKIIADIPGLIAGASQGKGLGIRFLKHIEKVRLLLHCIAVDSPDVLADYHTITKELGSFSPDLLTKERVILLTKTDLSDAESISKQLELLTSLHHPVHLVSVHDSDSVTRLKSLLTDKS